MEKPALDYVLDTAREDDVTVTLERGRQALGALGLSGSMALRKISAGLPPEPTAGLLATQPWRLPFCLTLAFVMSTHQGLTDTWVSCRCAERR